MTSKMATVTFRRAESAAAALARKNHRIRIRKYSIQLANRHYLQPQKHHRDIVDNPSSLMEPSVITTNPASPFFMHLNDDCLIQILSPFSIIDLCSVSETCVRLQEVAGYVFSRKFKKSYIALNGFNLCDTKRILVQFGSLINNLALRNSENIDQKLDLLVKYCGPTLQTVKLYQIYVNPTLALKLQTLFTNSKKIIFGINYRIGVTNPVNIFAKCKRLEDLEIWSDLAYNQNMMKVTTFPALTSFKFYLAVELEAFCSFILRHPKLRTLHLKAYWSLQYDKYEQIATNLVNLEDLKIEFLNIIPTDSKTYLQPLVELKKLKRLEMNCDERPITPFLNEFKSKNTLECLSLLYPIADDAFFTSLAEYPQIRELGLFSAHDANILGIIKVQQLTRLVFVGENAITDENLYELVEGMPNMEEIIFIDIDAILDVCLYRRLVKLLFQQPYRKTFNIHFRSYDIDYNKIDEVDELRLCKSIPSVLHIYYDGQMT